MISIALGLLPQVFADAAIVQWTVDRDTALEHLLHRLQCPKAKLIQALVPDTLRDPNRATPSDINSCSVARPKGSRGSGGGHGDLDGRLEVSLELETLASEAAACPSTPAHNHHPRHHRHRDGHGDHHYRGHDEAATALLGAEQARWGKGARRSRGPDDNAKKRSSSAPPKRSPERIPGTVFARGACKGKSEALKVEGRAQATAAHVKGWKEVYRGSGSACQISGLSQLTRHSLRVRLWLCDTRPPSPSPSPSRPNNADAQPSSSSSQAVLVATDHCHVTTLGGPPLHAPTLVRDWERAETYLRTRDNDQSPAQQQIVRGVIAVSLPADFHPRGGGTSSHQLPVGCAHVLEFAVAAKGDQRGDPPVGASSSTQWRQLAHGASGVIKVVGPWEGVCLLLRSYVVNQEGAMGPPSSVAMMSVPLMPTSNKGDRHVLDFVSTMPLQHESPP